MHKNIWQPALPRPAGGDRKCSPDLIATIVEGRGEEGRGEGKRIRGRWENGKV